VHKTKPPFKFSIDVFLNRGNLISFGLGLIQQANNYKPIGVSVGFQLPIYLPILCPSVTKTYGYDTGLLSRWQARIWLALYILK